MNTFLIDYDLEEGDDYTPVEEIIKKIDPTYWHHLDSTWVVSSNSTVAELTAQIQKTFPPGHGKLLIIKLNKHEEYKASGFTQTEAEALKRKLAPQSVWDVLRESQGGKSP